MIGPCTRGERHFSYAQRLAAQGASAEALPVFEQALALRPTAGRYLHWALALSETNRLSAAVEAMHRAIALQPANAVLPMFLAQILFDHADYTPARAWCTEALTHNAHACRSQALLALIDLAEGNIGPGYQRLQQPQPLSLSYGERLVLQLGIFEPPPLYQQPSAAWQSRLLLVAESYLLRHEAEARTLAQQLVQAFSAARSPHLLWADRLLRRGVMRLRRLGCHLRYIRQSTTKSACLLYLRAEAAYDSGQLTEAAALYGQSVAPRPMQATVQQRLCAIAYEQGDFRRALNHFRRGLKHTSRPSHLTAWDALLLGELQYQVGNYEQAWIAFADAATDSLQDYTLSYYLGLRHLRAGEPDAARRCFAQALCRLNPDVATLRLNEMYRVHQCQTATPVPSSLCSHQAAS